MVNVTRTLEQQLKGTSDGREGSGDPAPDNSTRERQMAEKGLEIQRQTTAHRNVKLTMKKTSRLTEGGGGGWQYSTRQQLTRRLEDRKADSRHSSIHHISVGRMKTRGHLSGVLAMHRILGVSITNDEETICCNDLGASYTQECTNYI
ncbi:LOW QUALITY PROTEIN: hypothetical protein PoB_000091300 [Plakobranchus ocellatus]|uniref:Uncharacterized protein n=1 Tax=Plakobranchus ocellatus TaxID=259542 RepID=A0AAV3XWP4_9GAST|nr:LOW QUALITY PROTEIN: hypothetical protein PoB_000091300 [Plakobranchus ocellatus]